MHDPVLFNSLESFLVAKKTSFVGCADLRALPVDVRAGLPLGVCIGVGLDPSTVAEISRGPTAAYAAEYERVNELLQHLADDCAGFLRGHGFKAVPGEPSKSMLDNPALATVLPHKTVATLAGIGWIGKCALLVTETHGSAVRYNTVLTDAPLPAGKPVEDSACGDCNCCVEACPAGAVSGRHWHPGSARGDFYDAFACRDTAGRLAHSIGIDHNICGICIAACPHTGRYLARSRPANGLNSGGAP